MSGLPLVLPLILNIAVQFTMWFNMLFPYNSLFENFSRNYYFAFSLAGFFGACIAVVFYRMLLVDRINKLAYLIATILQLLCILSSIYFFASSLTGWLVF